MNTRSSLTARIENDPALTAALGSATGLIFSLSLVGLASLVATPTLGSIIALHLSSAILGGVATLYTLCRERVEAPLLEVLRFLSLALPLFIVLQTAFGDEAYRLAGLTISSHAFIGFRIVMAATFAGLAMPIVEQQLAPTDNPFEPLSAEARYQTAIRRLAALDVAIEQSRTQSERELAAFDAKLTESGVQFEFDESRVGAPETVSAR